MANFLSGIISLTLGVVVLSGVFITTVKGTNVDNVSCVLANGSLGGCSWSAGETALWGLLTIAAVAGMVFGVLNVFGLA